MRSSIVSRVDGIHNEGNVKMLNTLRVCCYTILAGLPLLPVIPFVLISITLEKWWPELGKTYDSHLTQWVWPEWLLGLAEDIHDQLNVNFGPTVGFCVSEIRTSARIYS